ncbi:MAG: glycosyltransferase [Candidatus Binatia bacterium]
MSSLSVIFCDPERQDVLDLLSHPSAYEHESRVLKNHGGRTVSVVSLPQGPVVVKRHTLRTLPRWGESLFHGSPARRAWRGAQILQAAGIAIPRPLAAVEHRVTGVVQASSYVSEALLTQEPLNRYWQEQQAQWTWQHRRRFVSTLAEFFRTLHAAGIYVSDMKDENLFVEEQGAMQWKLYVVDLDRVTQHKRLRQQRRLKNLIQLERTLGRNARTSERLFFLYHYLGNSLSSRQERRQLVIKLLQLRDRKDREYARRRDRTNRKLASELPPVTLPSATRPELLPASRPAISCCIICFNEEANIRRCLESVKWCDEIVIVDSFSIDRTVDICHEYTNRVIQRPWPGYVEQKRFVLSQASHEWVLNVDADEEVSPQLRHEILTVLRHNHPDVDGFYVPRLVYYLGRWWWRGWYPGYRLRLFRKAKVRWGGVDPHEKVLLRGQADRLRGPLYHYTYDDIHDHLRALNGLTEVSSRELALRGKRTRWSDLLLRPLWRFVRFYFFRGGFRDGVPGFFVAVTSAFYVFLKYAKLWERTVGGYADTETQHSPRRSREALGRGRGPGAGPNQLPPTQRPSLSGRY